MIITGESGAGKSEACKLVLQFIADLSAAHSGRTVTEDEQSLEQQLLQVCVYGCDGECGCLSVRVYIYVGTSKHSCCWCRFVELGGMYVREVSLFVVALSL